LVKKFQIDKMIDMSEQEAYYINQLLGDLAIEKYNEFVDDGIRNLNYRLQFMLNALTYDLKPYPQNNNYYLKARNEKWTKIAYYFEYGVFNEEIKPKTAQALLLVKGGAKPFKTPYFRASDKKRAWRREIAKPDKMIFSKSVKAFQAIFPMTKALIWLDKIKDDENLIETWLIEYRGYND